MDIANLTAAWLSALVTAVGLASIISQVGNIKAQLDPFYRLRGEEHLAYWGTIQRSKNWHSLTKPPPTGPVLDTDINQTLGVDTVHISRRPICKTGEASWTTLLAVFHPHSSQLQLDKGIYTAINIDDKAVKHSLYSSGNDPPITTPWHRRLKTSPLVLHKDFACTTISRLTLVAFILLSQGREVYRWNGPSGLRLSYASYNGCYQIEWPLGERPTLTFQVHEGYQGGRDSFPISFARRPRKCVEMAVGVIDRGLNVVGRSSKIAFAGRKRPGKWLLKLLPKRFAAQRSASGLYNEFGGMAYQVDFLFRERLGSNAPVPPHIRQLEVPSLVEDESSVIYLQHEETAAIADCLDHLPWSPLAWSIHRGMKDILIAYALPYMSAYREMLAATLTAAVSKHNFALRHRGWEPDFITESMADQAASAIMGDDRCSGDACRILTAITEVLCEKPDTDLDQTEFWKSNKDYSVQPPVHEVLSRDEVIALVKVHLVWWSHDFDYEIAKILPQRIYVT